jgi:hypothetical protein
MGDSLDEPLVLPSSQGPALQSRARPAAGGWILALAIVANGAFLFGYHLAVVNGPLPQISKEFGVQHSAYLQGLVSDIARQNQLPFFLVLLTVGYRTERFSPFP